MLLHDGLGGNDLKLVDHLGADLGQGIATLGTHQILTLQTMLDPLYGKILRDGVQGVLVLLVPCMGRHLGDVLVLRLRFSKNLRLVEKPAQLLHNGFLTFLGGCTEPLMLRKAQCLSQNRHLLFQSGNAPLLLFVFRAGNGDRFPGTCLEVICLFHKSIIL